MIRSYISLPLPPKKRAKKQNSCAKRWLSFFGAVVSACVLCLTINSGQARFENYLYAQISQPISDIVLVVPKKAVKQNLQLDGKAALLLRVGASGRENIIFRKNTNEIFPIASLTKLMTAAVILGNPQIYDFEKTITISQNAAIQDDVPVFGNLLEGENYPIGRLFHLMLFYSSNDAAYALAEFMGIDEFVTAMNQKAVQIGLEKTLFYNATGLDIESGLCNHSSAADLLALTRHILEVYPDIFSTTITPGPYRTENGIFSINLWDGQTLAGGKTGYTQKAGGCMIMVIANDSGSYYINILLGSTSSEARVVEMQKLVNFANNHN